jgi:hypothetical protein
MYDEQKKGEIQNSRISFDEINTCISALKLNRGLNVIVWDLNGHCARTSKIKTFY